MSISDLQMTRAEKIYELGFMYYNKAVDGMEMLPEAFELINDIRARFGYLLYLKQTNGDASQMQELDNQIASQFVQLGEVCFGYYAQSLSIDAELVSLCDFISTLDNQINRENDIVKGLQNSAMSYDAPEQQPIMQQYQQPQQDVGVELSDSDFVMPMPNVAVHDDKEVKIESIEIESIERAVNGAEKKVFLRTHEPS